MYRDNLTDIVDRAQQIAPTSETLGRVQSQIKRGGVESVGKRDIALLTDEVQEAEAALRQDERDNGTNQKAAAEPREIAINKNAAAITSDGKAVEVRDLAFKDGEVLVRVADENGTETNVSRSTLSLGDDVSDLVDLAAKYKEAAPAIYAAFDNKMDFDHYADDVELIMAMAKGSVGVNGRKALNWLKNNDTIRMEPEAINVLFNAGRQIAIAEQPLIRRGAGRVTFETGIDQKGLTNRQKSQVAFMTDFAKLVGVDVEFFMSKAEAGAYVGENGSYKDNRIRIDLNAGMNYTTDSVAQIAITRTASHELTHWLQDIAPKEYQMLRDFVVEKMIDEGGGTLQDLINKKQARATGRLSADEAIDEIVADGCEMMLGNSKYIREYAERNQEGFNQIKNWLKKFLAKLKAAFKGVDSVHKESFVLMEKYADELLALWDNALKAGLENPATAPKSEAKKDAQQKAEHKGEKMSARENFAEDKYFGRQIDRIASLKAGSYITVGVIAENSPIHMVGIPAGKLYFDVTKIKQEMESRNDPVPAYIMKDIPKVLNKPMVITEYTDINGKRSASVYGQLYIGGSPVVVGVIATQTQKGVVVSKVQTVHPKRNFGNDMRDENILYIHENKKETKAWFQSLNAQMPLAGATKFGFIRSLQEDLNVVKHNGENSAEKKSEREYTITDREMLKNLNPKSVDADRRGYVVNYQQALASYEENRQIMAEQNARAADSKLTTAQREEARKRGLQAQRKMEEADNRLKNMESMPKVKSVVADERSYIEQRTTLEDSQIAPESGRYTESFETRIDRQNEERRSRLVKYYGQVESFGAIPVGETPARDVAVPRRTAKDNKVSQTVRTALEASITDLDTSIALQEKIQEDGFSYIPISDESAKAVAQQNLAGKTWGEALADFTKKMEKGRVTKYDVAEGFYLYNSAIQSGDTKTAVNILTELTARIREGAQMVQAVRILKQLSPEHKMYALTRSIRSLQEQIDKQHGENAPKIEMDQELLDNYLNAKTEEEIDEAKQKLYQDIAQQIPRTFVDKWNAWRYLAMLGNPKTILRNTLGNALFMPVVEAKNAVGAGLESIFVKDKSQRTKSLAVNGRKNLRLLGLDDYKSVESVIQGSGKYNDQENISGELAEAIREFKSTFNAPIIRHWQKATNYLMNDSVIGDYGFLRAHYSNAFAAVCMARGITAEDVSNGKVKQSELDSIRAYAIKEAQKATYRDANAFSNAIKKLRFKGDSKAAKVGNVFLEGILPFKSTPANVLVRAVEYSPIGAIKTIAVDSFKVKSGDMSATEFIDNLSSGLTGTALAALGWLLGRLGMLITDVDDDEERMGRQPYALQIGDTSYTLDWLAPEAVPLFVGAAIANIRERDEDVSWFEALFDSMTDMLQPMLELSMLSGVQDLLETMQYGDNGVDAGQLFYAFLINPAINYASQAVPTLFSQVANTFEKTSGFTYTGDIGGTMSKNLVRSIVKIIEKIPFVDVRQADFVDEWGRTENKGNLIQRFISSFVSPGYTSEIMVTDADVELERLEEATGTNVAPTRRGYTITTKDDDGKSNKVKLNVEQYEAYSREYGMQAAMMMAVLMSSSYYADMSDADKVKALQNVNQLADEYGKIASGVGYEIQAGDSEKKLLDLTSTGLPITEAYAAKIYHNSLDDNRDIKLNDKAIMFENWVAEQNWNETQKQAVMGAYGTFWTMVASDTEPYNNFANSTGLGEAEYFALNQAKTDQAGGHWSQAELKDYLSGTEYTKAQKAAIFDTIFPKPKSNPYK
jgi:hypothetical protein